MRRVTLLLIALFLVVAAEASAHAGTLVGGYGRYGVALLGRPGANLSGNAVAALGDGRAIVAGSDGRGFLIVRLRASGAPDPTFGRHGSLTVRFRGATRAGARAVALFRDGRILVAGTVTIRGVRRLGVARLLPDGHLDPNFGSGGVVIAGPRGAELEAMALQPEGEIVLAGSTPAGTRRAVLVVRLLADGTRDRSFGTRSAVDSTSVRLAGRARAVLVLPSGKIAVAAAVERGRAARATFLAIRLTPRGAFDPSFDGDGVARVATTSRRLRDGGAAALARAPHGALLLAGTARGAGGRDDATVVRLTTAGRPDPTFARAGVDRLADPSGRSLRIVAMARDARGRIVLGGVASGLGAAVLRLRAGGLRDRTFGAGGLFGGALPRTAFAALALRRDAGVLAAGTARIAGRGYAAVARLR